MSNSTHRVNVVRISEILPHTNADTLGIVQIGGYQVVVKKENYKVGDLALYIQPDTIVPVLPAFEFLWEGTEPTERRRRITVRRFRKEWSEGLLMPLSDFPDLVMMFENNHNISVGDDVAKLLGFTHYEEPDPTIVLGTPGRKLTLWQRFLRLFGIQPRQYGPKKGPGVYGMDSIKNYPRMFEEGEPVIATEKIHGSNARYYFDGKQFWVGSHKKWWKDKTNIWWRVAEKYGWIEEFCREFPKHTLRGEVTPTQGGYLYGRHAEEQFFAFDVQRPDGSYWDKVALYKCNLIQKLVPVVYQGPYDAVKIKALAEGNSLADGAKHIREGLVISPEKERTTSGLGRVQLKLKSMTFFEKEGKA